MRRLGAKWSLFFSHGTNRMSLHTKHVFLPKAVPPGSATESCPPTRSDRTRTTSFMLLADSSYSITCSGSYTRPYAHNPLVSRAVRDQLRLVEALQGIEGSLEPSLQAGTLWAAWHICQFSHWSCRYQHRRPRLLHLGSLPQADKKIIIRSVKNVKSPPQGNVGGSWCQYELSKTLGIPCYFLDLSVRNISSSVIILKEHQVQIASGEAAS